MTDSIAKPPPAPTLRSRLSLLVLSVALPLMAVAVAAIFDAYQGERARVEERLQEQARSLAATIDNEFRAVRSVLMTLAVSEAVQNGDPTRIEAEMRAAAGVLEGLTVVLTDPRGQEVLSTQWPRGERRSGIAGPDAARHAVQTGEPTISDVHIGKVSGRPVVTIAVPVRGAGGDGPPILALSAALPAARLSERLRGAGWPEGWVTGAIDTNFHLAARSVAFDAYYDTPILPPLRAALERQDVGMIRASRVDGTPSTIVFARAPVSRYAAALSAPNEAFLGPLRRELWLTLGPAAVVFGLGLAAALRMARRLADAIAGLAEERPAPARLREVRLVAERLERISRERDAAASGLRALTARLEQQVAERTEALAESEARLRGMFDSQLVHVSLVDLQGRRLDVNRAVMAFRRATREELIGVPMWETRWMRAAPETAAKVRDAVRRAAGGEHVRLELDTTGPDGGPSVLDLSFQPIRHEHGGSVRMILVEGYDISEIRALQARLALSSRLEALGQLAGGIAHDFNNVLQAVSGGVGMIARRAEDAGAVRGLAEKVQEAVGRGASVTRRLLGFARRDELRAGPVDVAALLASLLEMLTPTLGAGIRVELDVPADLPPLFADGGQLETVLINLATNARDAMPQGGVLRLAAAAQTLAGTSEHGVAPGRYVRLSATDTGTGMDAATLARATEPFFTTKPTGKGTGLGLAMARGFAQQSGGGMSIESAPGRGTTVTLWLPQAAPEPQGGNAAPADGAEPAPRAASALAPTVLLVEDSPLVRLPLRALLEAQGLAVLEAADADAALALLEAPGDVPGRCPVDLLLTDLSMPGRSGVELIRAARDRWPRLPAILLTGYAGDAADLAATADFVLLRKPVAEQVLTAQVAALLGDAREPAAA